MTMEITIENIYNSLQQVMDPEIPVLSVVELGMITDVVLQDNGAEVHMIPTFAACPAVSYIQRNIREHLERDLHISVTVIVDKHITWNSNRITAEAKVKLAQFGIAPPKRLAGEVSEELFVEVPCPHCGSTDTYLRAPFGSTLCRAIHFCKSCGQIFEQFKPLE
ncbi:1,2-phenylacetyl-CoA epoxidase subunit PaaD [Chitinophaga jiangningensis]|nr:1,2-phenylacetyl-CoA epoxidase subunit PaaD [Chitinophaga jiangningensis]